MAVGVGPGFAEQFAEDASALETTSVKSFEVSSLSWSNSGNSASVSPLNKRATTTANRSLLRLGRTKILTGDLYREPADNSTPYMHVAKKLCSRRSVLVLAPQSDKKWLRFIRLWN
jgi:hypothetical protein